MSCTRLFLNSSIQKRLFPIFDRKNPYELSLTYMLHIPKTTGGSGLGLQLGIFQFLDTQKTDYTETQLYRCESEQSCHEIIQQLKDGYCFQCKHICNCTRSTKWFLDKIPTS